ncbi:unnamed protein product [Orchesella dallaii]|uniref:DUF4149 domain-containing protein n=1 Tax=Orchesella dallaii TaxID=48710 RepID=A0ABP1RA39_9HEXA
MSNMWFQIVFKSVVFCTLITSLFYLGTLSWLVGEVVKNHGADNPDHNITLSDSTLFVVELSCGGIGLFAVLCQAIGSLTLLFNCGDYQKTHSNRWAIAQMLLLVIVLLAYFLPFAFSDSGGHNSSSQFLHKVNSHIQDARIMELHRPMHLIIWAFATHFIADILAVLIVVLLWRCAKQQGYTAVR